MTSAANPRRRRWHAAMLALLLCAGPAVAATPAADTPAEAATRVALWPGGVAPGSAHLRIEQAIVERSDDPARPDRIVTGITEPYMVVHRPARPNGAALLVMPGGAYRRIVLDKDGSALVPEFFGRRGYTLFVLRYRLPGEGHERARDVPLADAQRALRLIRANASRWGVDPARVGAMGFSDGRHAAASLGSRYEEAVAPAVDDVDRVSARPDFLLLMYPVIDMGAGTRCDTAGLACEPVFHRVSREHLIGASPSGEAVAAYSLQNRVHAGMPPVFLLHASDDASVPLDNSLLLFRALRAAGVPTEFHVHAEGGHGFGVRDIGGLPLALWPSMADAWIRANLDRTIDQED